MTIKTKEHTGLIKNIEFSANCANQDIGQCTSAMLEFTSISRNGTATGELHEFVSKDERYAIAYLVEMIIDMQIR